MGDSDDGDDGDFGIPPREPPTVTAHSSIQSRKAQDGQGVSPALRESRGNVWHTALCGAKCSVLHPVNAVGKIGGFF
ncbi:hypothetical protein AALC25_11650 [Lachnospiraceae bacterium 29-84]